MVRRVLALRIGCGREVANALVVGRLSCATGKSEQRAGKGERGDMRDVSAWARESRNEMGVRLRGPTRSRSHLKIPHRPFASFAISPPCIEYTFAHVRKPVLQGCMIRQLTRDNANISENMRAHFSVLGSCGGSAGRRCARSNRRQRCSPPVCYGAVQRVSIITFSKILIRPANKSGYRAASILPMREFAHEIASLTLRIRSPLGNWSA